MEDTSEVSLDNILGDNSPTPSVPKTEEIVDTTISETTTDEVKEEGEREGDIEEQEFRTLLSTFISEDNLEDSDKVLRADLLKKHKGTTFDANGNLTDEKGNIKATFDNLLKEINSNELSLDNAGNQVDSEGNIIKSAYEIAVENTVVNKLAKESGYNLVDEEGNPKIYTDDDEGFKDLTNDLSAERFQNFKQEFFGQNPVLTEVAKHLLSGNTLDTFQEARDYTSIDVTQISDAEKESYIRRSFEIRGMDKTQTDNMLQLIKDSNSLTDQAKIALPALQAYDDERISNRDVEYQKTIEQRNQEIEQHWDNVDTIIKEGKVSNITIPDADKEEFYDYISTAVDDRGNSKESLDKTKETLEQQLAYSYLRFKGFDLSKLVKTQVNKDKVLSLKERIKRSKTIKDSPLNDANVGVTSGDTDVTLESLLP